MRRLAIAALVLLAAAASPPPKPALNPALGVLIDAEHARELLQQCSRGVPEHVTGAWLPNAGQIKTLEALFPDVLTKVLAARQADPRPMAYVTRQYGGLIASGHKIVYVDGTRNSKPVDAAYFQSHARTDLTGICDGGDTFFGVEYDPQTRTFDNWQFNGVA